jgi:thiol:disulfide interchange protein
MKKKTAILILSVLVCFYSASAESLSIEPLKSNNVTISVRPQFESVRPGSSSALAVDFALAGDWHFYASGATALKVKGSCDKNYVSFSEPLFPLSQRYSVSQLNETYDVFSGLFTVYLPFRVGQLNENIDNSFEITLEVNVDGPLCSGASCIPTNFKPILTKIRISADAPVAKAAFAVPSTPPVEKIAPGKVEPNQPGPANQWTDYSTLTALILAFLAGITLNIMPCVLPVIPLKVLSIFEQAKQNKAPPRFLAKARAGAMGAAFCAGILLFFAALSAANIILRLGYNHVFQWGEHFRNPAFLIGMSILMMVLALFMFGVVNFAVPSFIAGSSGRNKGLASSAAMGFLAAILGTPCSFAILTAAFAWAQTQRIGLSTLAIMLIGLGMAAPYAILTSMPSLLKFLPKAGRWTEIFKQTMGFVLLAVAVWLTAALPKERIAGVLYFSVIAAFCIWMWGGWVTFDTPRRKKYIIRICAAVIAVWAGIIFLPQPKPSIINWQEYDSVRIASLVKEHKPVLIDFTADWCPNCKVVDKFIYSRKSIAELIKRKGVTAFIGDATAKDSPATIDLQKVYNEPAIPVTILYLPGQSKPARLPGVVIGGELKTLLEKLPDAKASTEPNG